MDRKKKIEDMLLAGCLGDCIGYVVEFMSWQSIQALFGEQGIRGLELSEYNTTITDGYVASDDTQMTLFCAEAIINACKSSKDINLTSINDHSRWSMLEWYETQATSGFRPVSGGLISQKVLWKRQAPGNTCLQALSEGAWGTQFPAINDSKGCGSVMRAAPYGTLKFLCYHLPNIWTVGANQAAQTHGNPDGFASAGAMAYIVALMLEGKTVERAVKHTIMHMLVTKKNVAFKGTYDLLKKAIELKDQRFEHDELNAQFGEGWVADECLAIAVYCAMQNDTVIDTIRHAANHRGDSDSTASVAAQLAALEHGLSISERAEALKVDLGPLCLEYAGKLHDAIESVNTTTTIIHSSH